MIYNIVILFYCHYYYYLNYIIINIIQYLVLLLLLFLIIIILLLLLLILLLFCRLSIINNMLTFYFSYVRPIFIPALKVSGLPYSIGPKGRPIG